MAPGERVACYSPTTRFRGSDRRQAFTAIGTVLDGEPYRVAMVPGFAPWRRAVAWHPSTEVPIRPLLPRLVLTRDKTNWGYQLRFGLLAIAHEDMDLIAAAMNADIDQYPGTRVVVRGETGVFLSIRP